MFQELGPLLQVLYQQVSTLLSSALHIIKIMCLLIPTFYE